MSAAHEVPEFAFYFRSVRPIHSLPVRIVLTVPGPSQRRFEDMYTDRPACLRRGAAGLERTVGAVLGEVRDPVSISGAADGDSDRVWARDRVMVEVDCEVVFREQAARGWGGWLCRAVGTDAMIFEVLLELAGPIRGIAEHVALNAGFVVGQVGDQIMGDGSVTSIAGCHDGVGDDLGIRINSDMTLVAVEAPGGGLVTVTGLGINGGDHPIRRDFPGDTECGIATILTVLAQDRGQQFPGLADRAGHLPALEDAQTREPVRSEISHEQFAGRGVIPIADRFAGRAVVIITDQHGC